MTKVQVKKYIFYFELSSKPYVDKYCIAVSMWKLHDFEIIFTSNDEINIQYGSGNGIGYIYR